MNEVEALPTCGLALGLSRTTKFHHQLQAALLQAPRGPRCLVRVLFGAGTAGAGCESEADHSSGGSTCEPPQLSNSVGHGLSLLNSVALADLGAPGSVPHASTPRRFVEAVPSCRTWESNQQISTTNQYLEDLRRQRPRQQT